MNTRDSTAVTARSADAGAARSVRSFLDDAGKAAEPEFFASLSTLVEMYGGPSTGLHAIAGLRVGFGLRFVVDACVVQRMLRRLARGKQHGLLDAARGGLFSLCAPERLDLEICDHAPDIAHDEGTTTEEVLGLYFHEVRPHIKVRRGIDAGVVDEVLASIPDRDDADYVALTIEWSAIGLITSDRAVREHGAVRTFDDPELGPVVVAFRKQGIVIALSASGLAAGGVAATGLIHVLALIPRLIGFCIRHARLLLGIGAVGGALYLAARALWPDAVAGATRRMRQRVGNALSLARELLRAAEPFVLAYMKEASLRFEEASHARTKLEGGTTGEQTQPPGGRVRLTARHISRCVLLAVGEPMHVREISARIASLGIESGARDPVAALRRNLACAHGIEDLGGGQFVAAL